MNGTLMSLVIVESVMTAALVIIGLYRSMLDMQEEDHIILDQAESHLAREQSLIRRKATMLDKYFKLTGIAWGVLLVVIFTVWFCQALNII